MNITTIIELENHEVEDMTGAKLVFSQEQLAENVFETCVECLKEEESGECIDTETAMMMVFNKLKNQGLVPEKVEDFSFEMPSCGTIKKDMIEQDLPQKIVISYDEII